MSNTGSREFTDQMAYNQISPGGLERFDTLFALLCCTVVNMLKGKGRSVEMKEFQIKWGSSASRKPVSLQIAKAKLKAWANRHNKQFENKEK